MAKNDQEDAYEKALVASLARVIDLVKFAETKNAALLAYASAWTVSIINLIAKSDAPPLAVKPVLPIAGALFVISALIALYSILPKADLSKFFRPEHGGIRESNLLFFGDIADVDIREYDNRVRERYLPSAGHSVTESYVTDLCCQIHVNSAIASRKYALFKRGAWIALIAMGVLVAPAAWQFARAIFLCLTSMVQ
jgi:hypothetical protein